MTPSIASEGGQQGVRFQRGSGKQAQRPEGRGVHLRSSTTRSGTLDVTTADGDKVSISFSAVQQLQTDQTQVRTRRGSASTQDTSHSSDVQVGVKVDGSLSDQEVADIAKLLQTLAGAVGGKAPKTDQSSTFTTLNNFQFQYKTQTELQYGSAYSYLA